MSEPLSPSRRRTLVRWGGVGLLAVALLVALRLFGGGEEAEGAPGGGGPGGGGPGGRGGPGGGADTLAATVTVVSAETIENALTTTGTLLPWEAVEVRAEVSGRITRLGFAEGTSVRAGQTLATLDTGVLDAQIEAARTRRDLAAVQAARRRELYGIGGLARQELDAAEADVRVLDAELAQLRAEAARLRIVAPFSGQIGLRAVSVGAFVSPGDRIATLSATDRLRLEFAVPELYLGRVGVDDAVVFTVPGQERTFRATVYAVEPAVAQETRAFTVRAQTVNPGGLSPGAFAQVELVTDRADDAVVVPASAVVPGVDSSAVWVVSGGLAQRRSVLTGIRTSDRVQVVGAVSAGDTVLTSGTDQVRPGQPVRATPR